MLKRVLLGLGAVVLALAALVGWIGYSNFGGTMPLSDGDTIGRSRAVVDGIVQAFVLEAGDGSVILIDANNDVAGTALLAELGRRGLQPDDVKAIFLTHAHGDHYAGVNAFPKAEVYLHEADVALLEGRIGKRSPARFLPMTAPPGRYTQKLTDGQKVQVGGLEVQAFHVPGHTPGSTVFLVDGVLYFGDSAIGMKDGTLAAAPWFFTDDPAQNKQALIALAARLKAEQISALTFGHSGSLKAGAPLQAAAAHFAAAGE